LMGSSKFSATNSKIVLIFGGGKAFIPYYSLLSL
jgi:hypothetical protein